MTLVRRSARPRASRGPALVLAAVLLQGSGCARGTSEGERTDSLATILAHADSSFLDGDYREAESAYEAAVRRDPDNGPATTNLATCYLKNRAVRKAQDLLNAHLGRHPDDIAARLVLARVFVRQGELGPAADALRSVLRSDPDNLVAHHNLGFIAYRSRLYEEAEAHLKRAVQLRPEYAEAHYGLGLTYLARHRLDDAIASLERAVSLEPGHVGAHFNLANAYARAGRARDAGKQQALYADLSGRGKARQEKEAQIKASSVVALQHVLEGRYPEALAEYQTLAGRYPDHAPLYNEIGRLQLRLGMRPEAFASLQKAVSLDPKLSEPHYLLAGLYRERGEAKAADRELEIFAALETIPEGKSGY